MLAWYTLVSLLKHQVSVICQKHQPVGVSHHSAIFQPCGGSQVSGTLWAMGISPKLGDKEECYEDQGDKTCEDSGSISQQ